MLQVPGVEADDVIGTLAVNSVSAGYKVNTCTIDLFQLFYPRMVPTDMLRISYPLCKHQILKRIH